jgi:hypothetical protein
MPELVTIPISYFELDAKYDDPDIDIVMDRRPAVAALFKAFKPWNINLEDIEVITQGKFVEQGVKFTLPRHRVSFFFGPAFFRLTQDGSSWETASITLEILEAAMTALRKSGTFTIDTFKTIIAMHVQPKTMEFIELLKPFVPSRLGDIHSSSPTTVASVVVWKDRRVTLDGSGSIANGIFLKLERDFKGGHSFAQMAEQLHEDEKELLGILGVEEEKP